jgi:hypothetical protein
MDFNVKKVLIRPNVADKDKGKSIIIDDPQASDENEKYRCRKVVAEKTLDRKETLKITIQSYSARGKHKQATEASSLFCASRTVWLVNADGLERRWTVRAAPADCRTVPRDSSKCVLSSHNIPK